MNIQTPKDDSNFGWNLEEMKTAYKEAAESDSFLFGDYDYSGMWLDNKSNDVY